ncbi:hypothetical protein J3F84DRAFT_382945 [Trichoderma pleuroticola]
MLVPVSGLGRFILDRSPRHPVGRQACAKADYDAWGPLGLQLRSGEQEQDPMVRRRGGGDCLTLQSQSKMYTARQTKHHKLHLSRDPMLLSNNGRACRHSAIRVREAIGSMRAVLVWLRSVRVMCRMRQHIVSPSRACRSIPNQAPTLIGGHWEGTRQAVDCTERAAFDGLLSQHQRLVLHNLMGETGSNSRGPREATYTIIVRDEYLVRERERLILLQFFAPCLLLCGALLKSPKVTPKVSMASTQCLTLAFEAKYQCGT